MPLAVGTGAKRESAEIILHKVGILSRLTALVTASDVKHGKPAGETFHRTAELMAVQPYNCVVFEDTNIGLQAAHNAGMDCYLVTQSEFEFHPCPN